MKLIDDFIANLTPGHFEGMMLYIFGSVTITFVLVRNHGDFKMGLKGINKLWEAPEITIYLWLWIFPHFVMSITFLQFNPPDMMYYFMGAILLFALSGRAGLEFIFNRFGGGKTVSTEIKQTITEKNDKLDPEQKDS